MKKLTIIFFLLFACILPAGLHAQEATYANTSFGKNTKIAGRIGNNIHVWSSPELASTHAIETTITIHIFSANLELKNEKEINLGKIRSWNVNFQFNDSCYYADLRYWTDFHERLLLKIDGDGNTTDVTTNPGLWTAASSDQSGREYFLLSLKNNLLTAKIDNYNTDNPGSPANMIMLDEGEVKPGTDLKKIILKKVNIYDKKTSQQFFASAQQSFQYPFLKLMNSDLLVCAYTIPEKTNSRDNYNSSPFMFLCRLDTSLSEMTTAPAMLRGKKRKNDESFIPLNIFPAAERLFIVSLGQSLKGNTVYSPSSSWGFTAYTPRLYNTNVTTAIRITMTDQNCNLLKDSVIASDSGPYNFDWENLFIHPLETGIDFFCEQKYSLFKRGITWLHVDLNGSINARDLVVDSHYDYFLPASKIISPGVLLVLCRRKGKIDILKLKYKAPG